VSFVFAIAFVGISVEDDGCELLIILDPDRVEEPLAVLLAMAKIVSMPGSLPVVEEDETGLLEGGQVLPKDFYRVNRSSTLRNSSSDDDESLLESWRVCWLDPSASLFRLSAQYGEVEDSQSSIIWVRLVS
jgi:hypothetical protein